MASIYVIRHGQASFGADDYDKLSALGERQADLTGTYLAQVGVRFDAAFSGDLRRQRDTGTRVLAGQSQSVDLVVDPRLNEINNDEQIKTLLPRLCSKDEALAAIVARGLSSSKDYQKVIDAVFNAWVQAEEEIEGIQAWSDYREGVQSALQAIMTAVGGGKTTAVFTSGGTIATIVGMVVGVGPAGFYQFYEPVMNCSITQLIYSSRRVSLSSFNDVGHLELMGAQHSESLVTYR